MKRYKSGSKWAVWRWMDIILNGKLYLRRRAGCRGPSMMMVFPQP